MAASATNTFTMTGLIPAFGPWSEAKRISVRLPASVTYPKGTVLGQVTGNNEVQSLAMTTDGSHNGGGTFTLAFGGETTAGISFTATAATVQTTLEGLASIGAGNIAVTGTTSTAASGGTYTITFQGLLGHANVSAIVVDATSVTGTGAGVAITTSTGGSSGSKGNNELVAVKIGGTSLGGTFTLTFGGVTSAAIAYNAVQADIQAALDAMSTLGVGSTQVLSTAALGASGGTFLILFTNIDALTNVGAVTGSNTGLTGSSPTVTITKIFDGVAPTSVGLWKAYVYSATDGSQTARAILEFDCATDASGNTTLGSASGGGDKQQTQLAVPAFISGTFNTQDLSHVGAGSVDDNAVSNLGRLIEGTVVNGLLRVG